MQFSEISEAFRFSLEAMSSNKLRAALASLGVVIGISFVILMGWILGGLDSAMEESFKFIGADMLYVDKWEWAGGKNWRKMMVRKDITYDQANQLCERLTTAQLAIPTARRWNSTVKYKNETYSGLSIMGTTNEYALTPAGTTIEGRFYSPFEDQLAADVIVIGFKAAQIIFPDGNPVGKIIQVQGRKFTVIGVVKKQGTIFFDFIDLQCFIPIKSFFATFGSSNESISISVKAGDPQKLDNVRAETEGLMRSIRNLKPHQENDFSINESKAFENNIATIRLYVWGIGIGMTVLSFIVGLIGIMNIMFVSVTERTKEIGIRKAIGAQKRSIWLQFIVESSILCLMGAFIAFLGCSLLVYLIGTFLPKYVVELSFLPPYMSFDLLLIASLVSIFVGVLAGLIPAIRAANLDPVDALRYE